MAIRNNQQGVLYLSDTIPATALFTEDGAMEPSSFPPSWRAIPDANETSQQISGALSCWLADQTSAALIGVLLHSHLTRGLAQHIASSIISSYRLPPSPDHVERSMHAADAVLGMWHSGPVPASMDAVKQRLAASNVFLMAARGSPSGEQAAYLVASLATLPQPSRVLLEVSVNSCLIRMQLLAAS